MKPLETAEMQLRNELEKDGWRVIHKGWPDFVCIKEGARGDDVFFIEVKRYKGEMLKKEQHFILTTLAKLGLSCYKWTPDGGYENIEKSTPMPILKKGKARFTGKRLTLEEKLARLTPEAREQYEKDKAAGKEWYIA